MAFRDPDAKRDDKERQRQYWHEQLASDRDGDSRLQDIAGEASWTLRRNGWLGWKRLCGTC